MGFLKICNHRRPSDGFNLEYIDKPPAVACILFNHDYSRILLVNQYRAGSADFLLEAPSGIVDKGEVFINAMYREVEEETGYTKEDLDTVTFLGQSFVSPGYTSEVILLYTTRVLPNTKPQRLKLDENEQLTTKWLPVAEVELKVCDMKTLLGLSRALALPKRRIGIYGGTFNPVTYSHLLTAERAIEELKLSEVIFEPVGDTYVKEAIIPAKNRFDMLIEATCDNPQLLVGTHEMRSLIQPPTIDTLTFYQNRYGWADIYFICGSDVLQDMPNWAKTDQLLSNFKIICIQRNNTNVYKDVILKNEVLLKHKDNIHIIYENVVQDISSTGLRNLVKNNQSIRYLTPDSVINYIIDNKLYN